MYTFLRVWVLLFKRSPLVYASYDLRGLVSTWAFFNGCKVTKHIHTQQRPLVYCSPLVYSRVNKTSYIIRRPPKKRTENEPNRDDWASARVLCARFCIFYIATQTATQQTHTHNAFRQLVPSSQIFLAEAPRVFVRRTTELAYSSGSHAARTRSGRGGRKVGWGA